MTAEITMAEGHALQPGDKVLLTFNHSVPTDDMRAIGDVVLKLGERWGVEFALVWNATATVLRDG